MKKLNQLLADITAIKVVVPPPWCAKIYPKI